MKITDIVQVEVSLNLSDNRGREDGSDLAEKMVKLSN